MCSPSTRTTTKTVEATTMMEAARSEAMSTGDSVLLEVHPSRCDDPGGVSRLAVRGCISALSTPSQKPAPGNTLESRVAPNANSA
jgi:hypothetical protein